MISMFLLPPILQLRKYPDSDPFNVENICTVYWDLLYLRSGGGSFESQAKSFTVPDCLDLAMSRRLGVLSAMRRCPGETADTPTQRS